MKYIARFKLKTNYIPMDYRRIIISFFKNAISKYLDGHFYNELYSEGAKEKNFVWAIRFNRPKFNGDIIELKDNEMRIILKFGDANTALIYYSSLLDQKNINFNIGDNNQLTLKEIRMVPEKEIIEDTVEFKIISPICLRQHDEEKNKDWYVSIGDENFGIELNKKLKEDLKYYDKEIDSLLFNFSNLKKVVVKAYGIKIAATIGTFVVKGDLKVLNHIKDRGLGSRRNSGFGMVEPIWIEEVIEW